MPTERAYPYAYLENELALEVAGFELDGASSDLLVDNEALLVDARSSDWVQGCLHVRAALRADARERLLPPGERSAPAWRVVVTAACRSSRWRRGFPLTQTAADGQAWQGTIPLERRLLHGAVRLTAYLVRTRTNDGTPGGLCGSNGAAYGVQKGVRLASSPTWTLQIDDVGAPPGGFLDTRWEDFGATSHPGLRQARDLVFYLDVEQPQPVLYLNSSLESLEGVLESGATVGLSAAVRDVLSAAVAQNVWMTLAMTSMLAGFSGDGDRRDLEGWQANVLARFERELRQEHGLDVADAVRDPEAASTLMQALSAVVQRLSGTAGCTQKILNEADKG